MPLCFKLKENMQFTTEDTSKLIEILRWRRDVRHFKQDPIPQATIDQLKTAIAMAPSVGNSRPWRVVQVEQETTRQQVIENYMHANQIAAQNYSGEQQKNYMALKLAGLREAPLHLAVFTDPDPQNGKGLGRQTMPETLVYSTIAAIHQFWLVARTLNVGIGWVSILEPSKMNRILNVDPSWKLTAYLCVGYPQTDETMPELHRKQWQENDEADWLIR